MEGPKIIHQSFTNFGDAEYAVDPRVVKRIRQEYDPYFCPLFRLQVWQWPDGSVKKFKNFGVGASSKEGLPIYWPIYSALRAQYGYLSKIEPASDIVVWWPFHQNVDGTPGDCTTFSDNIYYLVKRTFERTRELEEKARKIEKTRALTFARELLAEEKEENDRAINFEKSEAAYRLKQEVPIIRKAIDETTQEDIEKLYDKANAKPNPFVHVKV